MKNTEWNSIGYKKQLEYVNRLENLNQQLKELVKSLEVENMRLMVEFLGDDVVVKK